jgi:hypothetical protein
MEPTGCAKTSVRNYHYLLRNNAKDRSSFWFVWLIMSISELLKEFLCFLLLLGAFGYKRIHRFMGSLSV